jgi:hypothetical protein
MGLDRILMANFGLSGKKKKDGRCTCTRDLGDNIAMGNYQKR